MFTFFTNDELSAAAVLDPEGNVIGALARMLVDEDGAPGWVTVRTGIFGSHESFLPYPGSVWGTDDLHVKVSKYLAIEASYIEAGDRRPLNAAEESALRAYYGILHPPGPLRPPPLLST